MKQEKIRRPVSITRRIQLNINSEDQEERKKFITQLYDWQRMVQWSANFIMSHMYLQDQLREMIYLEEDRKVKLAKRFKELDDGTLEEINPDGILVTSRMNSTYQLLSKKFKKQIPTSILSSLNNQLVSVYNKEQKQYYTGEKSLRNYRNTIPMPIEASNMVHFQKVDGYGNIGFTLYGIPFKTFFGADKSGNKIIFERALQGEYKLCNSSIQLKDRRIWLLAVFSFDKQEVGLDPNLVGEAYLHFDHPIVLQIDKQQIHIGSKDEYLHRRLSIQAQRRKAQRHGKYCNPQRGRAKRLKALDHYKQWEKDFITTRMHKFSNELIKHCVQNRVGKLLLKDQTQTEEQAKENPFVLRNWSYFRLVEFIRYKAGKVGIELIVE